MSNSVAAVVEGDVDAAVVRRLAADAGLEISTMHVKGGKQKVRARINGYNSAARYSPFVVLVDLDRDYACAPDLIADWLPDREPLLCFRIAVRAVEAWLLANRERAAKFLRIPKARIEEIPEAIADPKRTLVDIARGSMSRDVREDIVPRDGSGRQVGAAYLSRLIEFVNGASGWRPEVAAANCDSLARARKALTALSVTLRLTK
jgi:hypothetical protein